MKKNNIPREQLEEAIKNSNNRWEVLNKFNISGVVFNRLLRTHNIESPKWDRHYYRRVPRKTKICWHCQKEFEIKDTKIGNTQRTCSKACSNSYFNTKKDGNGKTPKTSYIRICFDANPFECIICGEKNSVDVHHFDGDHRNKSLTNLIPLCPTHHRYMHTRKLKSLIIDKVNQFRETRGVA